MSNLGTKLLSHLSVAIVIACLMLISWRIGKQQGYEEALCAMIAAMIEAGTDPVIKGRLVCKE